MTYKPNNVDCSKVKPFLEELVDRCGGAEAAASYAGLGTGTVYRIRHEEHCTVQKRTATLIFVALDHKRKEDTLARENERDRISEGLNKQVNIDDKIERLVGY